jgi:hypothetical protein
MQRKQTRLRRAEDNKNNAWREEFKNKQQTRIAVAGGDEQAKAGRRERREDVDVRIKDSWTQTALHV